jgi:4'-phosphopantetheinyl transferase
VTLSTKFKPPPVNLILPADDIHIWCADLDQPASLVQSLKHTLSIDERMRAERFHFEKDRKRFIARRGILRTILGRYLNAEAGRLQFNYENNGKPALTDTFGNQPIHFNTSRSESLALFAFTRNYEIGVDIECIREIPEMHQIVENFFSAGENSAFFALPDSLKKAAFFNCWTRKEAFLKATGVGLSVPLDQVEVSLVSGEPAKLITPGKKGERESQWLIQDLKASSGFAAALATRKSDGRVECWQWYGWGSEYLTEVMTCDESEKYEYGKFGRQDRI